MHDPRSRTLRYWLGQLMLEKREQADFKRRHVTHYIDVDPATIDRFERAVVDTEDVDQILAAYARMLEDDDPRDYYRQALALWYAQGEAPYVEHPSPTQRAGAAAADALAGTPPPLDAPPESPDAKPSDEEVA